MIQSLQFDITVEAEKASEVWVIPAKVYQKAAESCVALANYTNQIMASRFSEVMWRVRTAFVEKHGQTPGGLFAGGSRA